MWIEKEVDNHPKFKSMRLSENKSHKNYALNMTKKAVKLFALILIHLIYV